MDNDRQRQSLDAYIKLMRAVESVNRRINSEQVLEKKVTMSQFAVLEALYFHDGQMRQVEIAQKILKTPGNLTLVIDNMVRSSLVTRKPSASDRRANDIALTDTGRQLIERLFPRMADAIVDSFTILNSDQLKQLSGLLKQLGRGVK
jgi:MarR family 2-MHQ and catechol resistance regulon transcriptional repressor